MRISLTLEKAAKLRTPCQQFVDTVLPAIRQVGLLTSSFPVVMYGSLNYRLIEIAKTQVLNQCKGNFDSLRPNVPITRGNQWPSVLHLVNESSI